MRHPDPHFGYPSLSLRTRDHALEPRAIKARPRFLRQGALILDTHVDAIDLDQAARRILTWGARQQARTVSLCTLETLVRASRDTDQHHALAQADLTLAADGNVAWAMRREGLRRQQAVNGQALMWRHLALADQAQQAVHLHGDDAIALDHLLAEIRATLPTLQVTSSVGPGRARSPAEDLVRVHQLTQHQAPVVFLGLSDPQLAHWMHHHRHQVQAVMVGLGRGFGQADQAQSGGWRQLRRSLGRHASFYARTLQSLLLGAAPSAHEETP